MKPLRKVIFQNVWLNVLTYNSGLVIVLIISLIFDHLVLAYIGLIGLAVYFTAKNFIRLDYLPLGPNLTEREDRNRQLNMFHGLNHLAAFINLILVYKFFEINRTCLTEDFTVNPIKICLVALIPLGIIAIIIGNLGVDRTKKINDRVIGVLIALLVQLVIMIEINQIATVFR